MAGLSLVLRQPIAGVGDVGGNLCLQSVGWVGKPNISLYLLGYACG